MAGAASGQASAAVKSCQVGRGASSFAGGATSAGASDMPTGVRAGALAQLATVSQRVPALSEIAA